MPWRPASPLGQNPLSGLQARRAAPPRHRVGTWALNVGGERVAIRVGVQLGEQVALNVAGKERAGVGRGSLFERHGVVVRIGGVARDNQALIRLYLLVRLHQQFRSLLGHNATEVEDIGALGEPQALGDLLRGKIRLGSRKPP